MSIFNRMPSLLFAIAVLGVLQPVAQTQSAQPQNYPSKPIRMLNPLAAGGPTDILSRMIAQPLSASLGTQIVIDNRPGASGNIVTDSITYDAAKLDLNFKISDPTNAGQQIPVYFHGVKPDQMDREGSSAIIDGSLRPDGTVNANQLMLKCPSRYEQLDTITVQATK